MIYFDISNGVSGDMLIGALIDIKGVTNLNKALKKYGLLNTEIKAEKDEIDGIAGSKVEIKTRQKRLQSCKDIDNILVELNFPESIKKKIYDTYKLIFEAEAAVHGQDLSKVHLHELASFDTFIEIAAFYILTEGEKICCSTFPLGMGTVKSAHGRIPLPAPATAEILKGMPVNLTKRNEELTTPTAAAILKNSAQCNDPDISIGKIGYGIGKRNFLRIFKFEEDKNGARGLYQIEFNIDDMTSEDTAYLSEAVAGCTRDLYTKPVFMKKGRLGTEFTALVEQKKLNEFTEKLFRNSSLTGFRYFKVQREILKREIVNFDSSYGQVRIKISGEEKNKNIKPEYDDLADIADKKGMNISELRRSIIEEYKDE